MMKQVYGVDGLSWTPGGENEEERGVKRNRAGEEFALPDSQQIGRGSQGKGRKQQTGVKSNWGYENITRNMREAREGNQLRAREEETVL